MVQTKVADISHAFGHTQFRNFMPESLAVQRTESTMEPPARRIWMGGLIQPGG
ncbi:MAG: hypothetical protein OXI66_12740 [Boseongicola sp.]|nr:hypothetical protein [Boseongicola sp.]MDE0346626.1 hypothetical protein [Boseongicola sp.]